MSRKSRVLAIFVAGIGSIIVVSVFGAIYINLTPVFTMIITAALVVVTMLYAYFTMEMAEEMREQRYDTVRPVIDIEWDKLSDNRVKGELAASFDALASEGCTCVFYNIGIGPAIDVCTYIQSPEGEKQCKDFGTLSVVKEVRLNPTTVLTSREGKRLIIEIYYKDVYGRELKSGREIIGKQGHWKLGPLQTGFIDGGKPK